MLLKLK